MWHSMLSLTAPSWIIVPQGMELVLTVPSAAAEVVNVGTPFCNWLNFTPSGVTRSGRPSPFTSEK